MPRLDNLTSLQDGGPILDPPLEIGYRDYDSARDVNDWLRSDMRNYSRLQERLEQAQDDLVALQGLIAEQVTAYSNSIATAVNTLNDGSYSKFEGICLDFHSLDGVDSGSTTAEISTEYGQVTPTLLSTTAQNQFTVDDVLGVPWVPRETVLSWAGGDYGDDPTGIAFTPIRDQDDILRAFDRLPYTALLLSKASGYDYTWLKITLPTNMMANRLTNTLTIHPYPELAFDVYGVVLGLAAGGTHVVLDSFEDSGTDPELARKLRWFFPPAALDAVYIALENAAGVTDFGVFHLGAYFHEWSESGILSIETFDWNPDATIRHVKVFSPSSQVPIPTYSSVSTTVEVPVSLLPERIPQVVTALQITY